MNYRQLVMKKVISMIIVVAMMVSVLIGCGIFSADSTKKAETQGEMTINNGQDKDSENIVKENITLFFANEDNSAVPSEIREIEVKEGDRVRAAIEALIEGPKTSGLKKTIPEGTKLLNYELKGDLAIVNFSKEYGMANDIAEIVERVSLVNTLTGLEGIKKVKILIEGNDLIGPSGEPFGELTRVALDDQGRPIPGEVKKITLYFGNKDADALIPEQREIAVNQGESMEKIIVDELIKGPNSEGLSSTIPEGTKLLSVETKDGICTVDFSSEFVDKHPGGSAGEIMTLDSIVNSLTELDNVKRVQFLIEGAKREAFIHLELDQPLERNEDIIRK